MSKFFIIEPLYPSTTMSSMISTTPVPSSVQSASTTATPLSVPSIDILLITEIFANVVAGISFALNFFLLMLIIKKTPKQIADYKIILLQNWFIDLIFIIGNFVVKGKTDYKNGAFFLIGGNFLTYIPQPFDILLFMFYVFALFYCLTSTPVQFLYRYCIICRGTTLSTLQYLLLLLISTIGAIIFAGMFGYVIWPNPTYYNTMANLLKADNLYFNGIPKFVVAEIQQWPLVICFVYGYFLVTSCYVITVIACLKVWKKLKKQSQNFSDETRRLHKQMTKTMIMQATVPLFLIILPILLGLTFAFGLINVPGMGMLINSICGLTPVANPLVTIISIKTYREVIVSSICKFFGISRQMKTVSISPSRASSVKNTNFGITQTTKHS